MTRIEEKVCVALGACSVDECKKVMATVKLCELRLDLLVANDQLRELLSSSAKAVVTYRPEKDEDATGRQKRLAVMKEACVLGAAFIDIELEAVDEYRKELIAAAKASGTKVIISYHNFSETPSPEELKRIVDDCFAKGADIAKVACLVKSPRDNAALLGLLTDARPLIIAGMGEEGKVTRVIAPLLGSLFTFASPPNSPGTAPGQLSYDQMMNLYEELKTSGIKIEGLQ